MARVLVVEDEKAFRFALSEFLALRGNVVDCAETVEDARRLLSERAYQVAVVDLCLGDTTRPEGIELARWAKGRFPTLAVLVYTGFNSARHLGEARSAGADEVVRKGVSLLELEAVLNRLVAERAG